MSQSKNLYEGMYIINSTLSDDARNKVLEKIKTGITQKGGEILKIHDQGRKRLAYEINGRREGYYFLIYFELPPEAISELWAEYRIMEDLVRYITLRAENVMEKVEFKSLIEQ